jgi:hypothetical protein
MIIILNMKANDMITLFFAVGNMYQWRAEYVICLIYNCVDEDTLENNRRDNQTWTTCQCLATGRWFSLGTLLSSTNKTDHHYITEMLLKVALNTIKPTNKLAYHLLLGNSNVGISSVLDSSPHILCVCWFYGV